MCVEAEAHRTTEFKVESTSRSRCEMNTSFVLLVRNGHVFFEFPSRGRCCPMLCYCRKLESCKSTSTLNPSSLQSLYYFVSLTWRCSLQKLSHRLILSGIHCHLSINFRDGDASAIRGNLLGTASIECPAEADRLTRAT